jgi:hypothetical protein
MQILKSADCTLCRIRLEGGCSGKRPEFTLIPRSGARIFQSSTCAVARATCANIRKVTKSALRYFRTVGSNSAHTVSPSRGGHHRFLGIPLAVSAVSGSVPV